MYEMYDHTTNTSPQAKYLYIPGLSVCRSKNSLSINFSIHRFTTFSFGLKNVSCLITSAIKSLCFNSCRAFIIRTIAASIVCVLSSSTFFLLCELSSDAIGIRSRFCLALNFVLTWNLSDVEIVFDFGSLVKTLYFPQLSECKYFLNNRFCC